MTPEFWRMLAGIFAAYIESETNSPAGRLNLALCVWLGLVAIVMCAPSVIVVLARIIFGQRFSPTGYTPIPLIAFISLAIVAVMSYVMLPKRPSDWINPG